MISAAWSPRALHDLEEAHRVLRRDRRGREVVICEGRVCAKRVRLVIGDSHGPADREEHADEAGAASATASESDAPDGPSGSSTEPPAQFGYSAAEPSRKPTT